MPKFTKNSPKTGILLRYLPMPLLQTKTINSNTYLGIWQVTESIEELKNQLLALRPMQEIPTFKAETRTKEWLAARILAYSLLAKLTSEQVMITRQETGQPVCTAGNFQVSLTHSGPWVGALVSGCCGVGIDIEMRGNKVEKLIPRFLNDAELAATAGDVAKMHLYWSAKETLYKIYSQKKLLFKENLLLQDFDRQPSGQFTGTVQTDNMHQTYDVLYEVAPDYVLTYVFQ